MVIAHIDESTNLNFVSSEFQLTLRAFEVTATPD
jgi:hypothetical protein